ncbi:MAG: tetratricopeptide repeat protein [Candidatus Shapirobacteria bacterium]|nr:tetratricopeptide repeat protein [Candidatus Shapirobacteria bacterium]MDD5074138.1 tetratricopeptide repeat protein [Candidatus Shapirobacteria bacterium]
MALNKKQKKYLKEKLKSKTLAEIAQDLAVKEKDLEEYLAKIWRPKKLESFLTSQNKENSQSLLARIDQFCFKKFFQNNQGLLLLLFFLVIGIYANSLGNEFLSDDIAAISQNQELDKLNYIAQSFPVVFRPFLYFLTNLAFGRSPIAFRMINITSHLLAVTGLLVLVSLLINKKTGIVAALIFAVHPLLVESVTWISGGSYSQYAALLIWAIIFYLLSIKNKKYYWFSLLVFLLALGSSEKAMAFPFLLLALIFTHWQDLGKNKSWQKTIVPLLIGLGWIGFYLAKVPERLSDLETSYYQDVSQTPSFLLKLPIAVASYIKLFFWPQGLTLYHSETLFSKSEFSFLVIVTLAFLIFTICLFFSKNRRLSLWPTWFLLSLAPVLSPFGVSWVVAERYVYLGTVGLAVIVSVGLAKLFKKDRLKPLGILTVSLLVISLGIRTIVRNIDWKNQDNLWLAAAKTSPNSPQNHNNLGDLWARRGDLDQAIEEFKMAIVLNPGYGDAYHNLANVYQQRGDWQKALENYQQAIEINPNIWQTHQNMAAIYFEMGEFEKAKKSALRLLEINPELPYIYRNLGLIYFNLNQFQEAKQYFEIALQINPQDEEIKQLLLKL